jgi:hypothetical protein
VGFLGLSARESFVKTDAAGYLVGGSAGQRQEWLPELRKECDFRSCSLACPRGKPFKWRWTTAASISSLTGFKHQMSGLPARINQSTILYAEDEGKFLGELRFSVARGLKVDVQPLSHTLTRNVR